MPTARTLETNWTETHQEETYRRFGRGVLFSLGRYGAAVLLGFAYWWVSARFMGAEVIGTVALLTSILGLFRPLSTLGEYFALIPGLNHYARGTAQAQTLFWKVFQRATLTNVVLSVVYTSVGSIILLSIYRQPLLIPFLWVYMIGFYILYNMTCLFNAPMLAYQQVQYCMLAECAAGIVRVTSLIAGVGLFGPVVTAAVGAQVAGFASHLAVTHWNIRKIFHHTQEKVDTSRLKTDLKEIYRFSLKSLPATASISILQHADRLILGYFTSATWLGIYTLAYALFERALMLGASYEDMVFASTAQLKGAEQTETIRSLYHHALKRAFKTVVPVVLVLCFISHPLLSWFGPQFTQGQTALVVLLAGIVFDLFARLTTGLMGGLNYPGSKALIVGIGALANLTLNVLLIPSMGIVGAAWANTLGYVLTALLCIIWLRQVFYKAPMDVSICNVSTRH